MLSIHCSHSELVVDLPVLIPHGEQDGLVVDELHDVLWPDVLKLAENEAGGNLGAKQRTSRNDII